MAEQSTTDSQCENNLLLFNKEDNKFIREMVPFDSQELLDLKEDAEFSSGTVKREVSIPLSPPNTPTSTLFQYELVPSHLSFKPKAGRYDFQLHFEEEKKPPSKSCLFTYSKQLKKLFVQKDHDIPFTFRTSFPLPENFEIRAYMVFEGETYKSHTVEKCPNDIKEWAGRKGEHHIVINKKKETSYQQCPLGHFVTITPSLRFEKNALEFSDAYSFACYTTCRGGINRRNVSLLFALYANYSFCGQAKVNISICSSPGRDRKSQERKATKSSTEPETNGQQQPLPDVATTVAFSDVAGTPIALKRPHETETASSVSSESHTKKFLKLEHTSRAIDNPNHIYTLKVRGKEKFEMLSSINDAMEDANRFYRISNNIQQLPLYDNGLILNNGGLQQFRRFDPATKNPRPEDQNEIYRRNFGRFEELKKKVRVKSLKLERAQSDPTNSSTYIQSRFILPWDMFKNNNN